MSTRITGEWLKAAETEALVKAFEKAAAPLRFVGGAVRDSLLKRTVQDVDAATPAKPEAVKALLEKANIRAIPTGIEHGTITALLGDRHFEITTLRKDLACDGRHAEVEYTQDWEEDARRRDFTVNALYAEPSGSVHDYVGGLAHLNPLQILFIGDAGDRIQEDALRILRFFRFCAQLAAKETDEAALAACKKHAGMIGDLSGERIAQEMLKLLSVQQLSPPLLSKMQDVGVVNELGLPPPPASLFRIGGDALTRLALWAADEKTLERVHARWKLSTNQLRALKEIMQVAVQLSADEKTQKKLLRAYGADAFTRGVRMAAAQAGQMPSREMLSLAANWAPPPFPVTGDDLLRKGFKEGPELGAKLKELEEAWETKDYKPTREELLK